jgi:hypothetical protein
MHVGKDSGLNRQPIEPDGGRAKNLGSLVLGQMCCPVARRVIPIAEAAFGEDCWPIGGPDCLGRPEDIQNVIYEPSEWVWIPSSFELVTETG